MSTAMGNLTQQEIFDAALAGDITTVGELETLLDAYFAEVGGGPEATAWILTQWAASFREASLPHVQGFDKYEPGGSGFIESDAAAAARAAAAAADAARLKVDVVGGGGLTAAEIQRDRQTALSATIGGQRATFGEEMAAAPYTMGQVTPFARGAMEAQFDPFSAAYSLQQLTPMATGADVPYPVGGIGGPGAGTTFQEWMRDPTSQRLGAEDWTGYLGKLAGGIPQGAFAADPSVAGGFSFTPSSLPGGITGYTQDQLDQRDRMKTGWERLADPVIGANIIQQYALGPGAAAGGGISPMARSAYINALQDQFSAYQATPQGAVTPLMSKFLGGGFGLGYGV